VTNFETDLANLNQWITSKREEGAIAVLAHKNGDMDTIGSAVVLASIIGPSARACGLHVSKVAQRVLEQVDGTFHLMDEKKPMWPRTLAGIIVVDSASVSQTGLTLPEGIPVCAIDHHEGGSDWDDADLAICWKVSSTAEMIHQYSMEYHSEEMDSGNATLLVAGIITDTGRFKHAAAGSFTAAGELISTYNLDYAEFVESLEREELNHSQRMAIAKALSRLEAIDAGEWFLLHTQGSTNEGVTAHSLLAAGAEVALVVRRAKDETRLIGRANRAAVLDGVHLGDLMASLCDTLGGEGGGHPGAAGWSGEVPAITARSGFIAALSAAERVRR
jgi:nanoRNase/pAp phosphatase (c-di-AMP/oligoRNAs hydrolase)